MSAVYIHCYLRCPDGHTIPLPHPSLLKTIDNSHSSAKGTKNIVVVCPECGLASAYCEEDVIEFAIPEKTSLFQQGECRLVAIEIECAGHNCTAPKVIHAVQGVATGTWRPKVVPKHWRFDASARCEAGHQLLFDEPQKLHMTEVIGFPF
jgi:hypothetical protein